jgi:hypothetical protein
LCAPKSADMKKFILSFALISLTAVAFSQAQIENAGFELSWEDVTGAEDEPLEWSSLKTADALTAFAPVVAFKDNTTAHTGTYCIRLKAVNTGFGPIANGLLTNGRVHADFDPELGNVYTDAGAPQWNLAFSDRPDSLVFWVKHVPVGADQSKFEVLLHDNTDDGELPHDGVTSNWVGKARADITATYNAWTRVSVPFIYYNTNTPDYLLSVISAGDSTMAVANTEMWIDDIELIYNPNLAVVTPPAPQTIDVSTNGTLLTVTATPNAAVVSPITQEWKYSLTAGSGYVSFGTPETGTTYMPTFASTGIYYVICEVNFGTEVITSNEVEIVVTDPAVNTVTVTPSSTQTILAGVDGTLLTANETPAAASSREWLFSTVSGSGYAAFGTPETGLTYTPNFAAVGTYYVICESDFSGDVQISNEVTIMVPSAAGIHEENLTFEIFNNGNGITLTLSDLQSNTRFACFTTDGKLVYSANLSETISVHNIPFSGVLIYQVISGDQIITGKINL